MEIINETVHAVGEINGWEIFRIVISIFIIGACIWAVIVSCQEGNWLPSIVFSALALLWFGAIIICSNDITNKVEYREYDVIFTEPVDMDELTEKYEIKGNDGRIWHLEDKH